MSEAPTSPVSLKHADPWNSMSLSRLTFTGKDPGITKTITALGILSLISMLLGGLSVLLLIQLSIRQDNPPTAEAASKRIGGLVWMERFLEASVVLASLCVMLCFCSVVSCTAQCYFAAKMLKLPQGEERARRFLGDTSGTRFLAVSSFFTAIPVFIATFTLYIIHEFSVVPAALSTSFLGLGLIFIFTTFGRSVWLWRREHDLIIRGVGVFEYNGTSAISSVDGRAPFAYTNNANTTAETTRNQSTDNNLSTLV
ncbi:uncharacterized protein LOC110985874 [Acanthaster planci]|uniref:Uncharacterized protein LOC110985874 n=1 Tax=Acanthaster planci TaxID=133434 RepID=A0A8B7ZBH4_ACAPL|nr:uncharacterized protein LOC110985874 [Acanthaster planci]XP_022102999.1 uncharacterized protein LOC110985874 [Acanthaster planci]XP_022103000.1 uncharacterized protein LOC110985874 [Acanthaster planci]XP_022103001.1 uncharacterized protein LOC110985874 [Acanthaster planci]XP_022103002.1 uncharacterized protein LOC110985874 [Acanthaster planci]